MSSRSEWDRLREKLARLSRSLAEEIHAYPRPITACDAQFNHLLELRRLLPVELQRLEAAARDPGSTVQEFLRSSPCAAALGEFVEPR